MENTPGKTVGQVVLGQVALEQADLEKSAMLRENETTIAGLERLVAELNAEVATLRKLLEEPLAEVKTPEPLQKVSVKELKAIWENHLPESTPFNAEKFGYYFPKQFEDKAYTLEITKDTAKIKYL